MPLTSNAVCRTARCLLAVRRRCLLGGCSFDLGSFSLGPDKEAQPKPLAQAHRRDQRGKYQRCARPRSAGPGAGPLRQDARSAGRIRKGARARSLQRAGAVWPRPGLSGRKTASAGDRGFHRRPRPDAATRRTSGRARDQLSRTRQGQGSRHRSRRGRAGRAEQRASLDRCAGWPMNGSATRPRPPPPTAARIAIRPRDDAARSGLARVGG